MDKLTFEKLLRLLTTRGQLRDGRVLTAGEKIFNFLHVLKGNSQKDTAHRYQHSKSIIHDVIYDTIHSMMLCKKELIRQLQAGDPVHDIIRLDLSYFPFFEHAVGALDGSHLPAVVSGVLMDVCRNRKGWVSQKVLGVCGIVHISWSLECYRRGI